jgi:hypothetical protein
VGSCNLGIDGDRMPFQIETKTEMFIRCGRLCCLCLKQCGTNIEAAHIVDEHAGGSNDASNGIPVCFDCHEEFPSYNDKHPKGNKFRSKELIARRDRVYQLVESGAIYAQLIAERSRSGSTRKSEPELVEVERPKSSAEARRFLASLLSNDMQPAAPARKLAIFNKDDRAYVLDELTQKAADETQAVSALATIVNSAAFPKEEAVLIAEQMVRAATFSNSFDVKAEMLQTLSETVLASVYDGLRLAFFEEAIEIVNRDQFEEVNKIVPPLVQHVKDIPPVLHKEYVLALLKQARSDSFKGAPAARSALASLPDDVAKAGVEAIDADFLSWNSQHDYVRKFVKTYAHLAGKPQRHMLEDFVNLSRREFADKYLPDE